MNQNKHECTVGIYWEWSSTELVNVERLCQSVAGLKDAIRRIAEYEGDYRESFARGLWENNTLDLFDFCPYCGHVIDKDLRRQYDEAEAKIKAVIWPDRQ